MGDTRRQNFRKGCLSDSRFGHFVTGAQAAGAQGYPTDVAIYCEGGMLDIGHETGLGPPLGVTHVVSCMPYLAAQLTHSHLYPLQFHTGEHRVLSTSAIWYICHFDGCPWIK